ncbi:MULTISPECIES: DUF6283 family protein [Streptomyces]|uniref:DUF6283 family protein n=1 Tax=Streptomyces TaxID=1883 RepID=UPI0004CCBEAB|nr:MULTISPECIES: DUF6283 family protein [Streptomyces]KOT61591.1 hypothetical protein ADK43_11600 [Streptomyces rimosus subsp. rimosus]
MSSLRPPAPRPCESCPYRKDVASGVWAHHEYEKLRRYDAPTTDQPTKLFQCHQDDCDSMNRRLCAGWVGCHDSIHLLALRIGILDGSIDDSTYQAALEYVSPAPLFASGNEAADHGQAGLAEPSEDAKRLAVKITRIRGDLET